MSPVPPPTSSVVDTGPVMQGTHAIIRPEAVGPLHVGTWKRAAMSFVYTMTVFSGPNGSEIIPVHGLGNDTATVVVVNDTVTQIQVTRPGARTVQGVQVGTPLTAVRALPGATVGHDGTATTVRLPHECGIVFSTADSGAHSGVPKGRAPLPFAVDSAVIRTIIVGRCTGA